MGCQICHSSCTVCRSSSDSSATELRRCPLFNVTYVLLIDIALYLGLMLLLRYFRLKRTAAEDANAN